MTPLIRMEWVPTQEEFDRFAHISGDDNPIHVDPEFSARTRFGRTVSHGMLIYTKLWGMVSRTFPARAHRFQSMMFPNPAYAGEALILEISETPEGQLSVIALRKADEKIVFQGQAQVA
ncbi:MaoC/PaaZ C-terminal domain-containing protein [Roseinatronobacter sp. S2]|uniref:MaoC family dehydratase n=1 Tax=Roseinatronobacter sp. S2 TaxID=3035471 RepID=UPI002410A433|nr:MaoC/PaaZ C-terminal domain-containing protein [Roseinatronobacter sp. S2]WFE76915.1 MaoC/PaaZ C-terminal domain-containing protein [Roseinatronobacter sp. S2]